MCKWGTTNLGIKFLSLFTAILLWFHVITERTYEITVVSPIQCIKLDKNLLITKAPPESAKIKIKGKGKELLRFSRSVQIILDLSETDPGWQRIDLKEENVELPPESKITIVSIPSPKSFVIRIEEMAKKTVKIIPDLKSDINFQLLPESIEISGGKSAVTAISKITTEEINPSNKLPATLRVRLVIPEGIKTSTDFVTVILKD